ncbi:MAG: hypothetical protein DRI75_02500 [Bacteroidetes bacterium]|nr:MAG: hypothetical protein DRI75_02500 [Bacteroidota bacterium]
MLKLLDNYFLDESKIWLNRYMPVKNLERCLKNGQFNLNFTRIELYDDILEGWRNDFPELNQAWKNFVSYAKRITNDGGIVESGKCVVPFFLELNKNLKENSHQNIFIIKEIENYLKLIETNFASCWFITESLHFEERYMWNIYGKSSEEPAAMISIKWIELKTILEKSKKCFVCGLVDYDGKSKKNALFKKHSSYSHEKEFRIISSDFKHDYNPLVVEKTLKKIITLSEPISSNEYNKIKSVLKEQDEIKYSNLPIQWKLKDIKNLL